MTMAQIVIPLSPRELAEHAAERIKDEAFDEVRTLWDRRQAEGSTQKQLADAIGRDQGWVSRNLSAPGNWTLRTIGAFAQGLNGVVSIHIHALEDRVDTRNYDAYDGYPPTGAVEFRSFLIEPPKELQTIFQSETESREYAR